MGISRIYKESKQSFILGGTNLGSPKAPCAAPPKSPDAQTPQIAPGAVGLENAGVSGKFRRETIHEIVEVGLANYE